MSFEGADPSPRDATAGLRASAQGWHGAQLAVLGFIGLCGVLQSSADSTGPRWLEIVAGVLVLLSLVMSCIAIAVVATVAWPMESPSSDRDLERGRSRLRSGIRLTFVAVGLLALAGTSSWWPSEAEATGQIQVDTSSGTVCGDLRAGEPGVIALDVNERRVHVAINAVTLLQPVDACE